MRLSRRIWELRNLQSLRLRSEWTSRGLCLKARAVGFVIPFSYATPSGGRGWVLLACSSVTSSLPSARKLRGIS